MRNVTGWIRGIGLGAVIIGLSACGAEAPVSAVDWLLDATPYIARIETRAEGTDVVLTNDLIERRIRLSPDAATIEYRNLRSGEAILRAVRPEAVVELDGRRYPVGGLLGQPDQAYLLESWAGSLSADSSAFHYLRHRSGEIEPRLSYVREHWGEDRPWPPKGKTIEIDFGREDLPGIIITVHYEIYDGLPLLSKWVTIRNGGSRTVRLNSFISETLAVVESGITANEAHSWDRPNIHIESDYAYLGSSPKSANRTAFWVADPAFTTQVDYGLNTPCLLECRPPIGPDMDIAPGADFDTFRTWELIHDSSDRERKGLALRRMYRTIAPWVTENPIFLHLKSIDPAVVREAVDQCAAAGFEMIILSFGSGLDMENTDPIYLDGMKALADYAHSKGIRLGGYSLLASRSIGPADDVINPATGKMGGFAAFGSSPCLGSAWGVAYFQKLKTFFERTGFDILEHDGSYPGDICASNSHPGHRDLNDSQWTQWKTITGFYAWCRERGIYLNVPDWYFLSGATKTAVGYREVNWSLPRDRQIILGRQNLFDGTWEKTPSMGWTFVPLVAYHGGGEAATLEPFSEHLDAYQAHLVQNFGFGVQACYRGTRLYDTVETKDLVVKWIDWYKTFRSILNSDVIHIRRPDGRHLDAILHVNPALKEKGFLLVFNPTDGEIAETLSIPLYYTGLRGSARIREGEGTGRTYGLDREYKAFLPVRVPARGFAWYVIE